MMPRSKAAGRAAVMKGTMGQGGRAVKRGVAFKVDRPFPGYCTAQLGSASGSHAGCFLRFWAFGLAVWVPA